MQYTPRIEDASTFQSTARAEDGSQSCSSWTNLCEGVLIPIGSLFAIFLFMLGVMLIAD
ncbi:hypothetical protein [Granulicella sp. L60]|jgi:hypothetical protein|uniref:hypothetical protein n=1 Tax=Granulicella sp. L60 TaxID=1641866 RepID=UPI00131E1FD7|nr:hypothetical protein [Granulicella sp. L60]